MNIMQRLDLLRGQFLRLRGARKYDVLAEEMDLSPKTLITFANGGNVSLDTLYTIERWCHDHETMSGVPS